jgi:hypothetical protein
MDWGFSWLLSFVNAFWETVTQYGEWIIDGAIYALQKGFYYPFDTILTAVQEFVCGINLSGVQGLSSAWGSLPGQLLWWIHAVSLDSGLAIIGSAIVVRMLLNLIPAALTRI